MPFEANFRPFSRSAVTLNRSEFRERFLVNRDYLISLDSDDLLFNYRHEAVLNRKFIPRADNKMGLYDSTSLGGWESPGSQVRGQFLGHWLSAAARIIAATDDDRLRGKADYIVSELARFQAHNGNGWIGSIPEKYFEKMAKKQPAWAPQYVLHKTLMGLWEMYKIAGNKQALEILDQAADWFHQWSGQFSPEDFQYIINTYETGGLLEVWSDLYGETGDEKYLDLIHRYTREDFFHSIATGEDVLSLKHANTIIPEIYGAARAFEVTGEEQYRDVPAAFWSQVVPSRMYATGGHSHAELWSRPNQLVDTLLDEIRSNQEYCTVYNMMWLSKYLFQWTGDVKYADYYERNLYNGILSGHNPETGTFTYYHPFKSGGAKRWDSRTQHFWCCYGTGVQAQAELSNGIYFHNNEDELLVNLFIPSTVRWSVKGTPVTVTQETAFPRDQQTQFSIEVQEPTVFGLALRIPWWIAAGAEVHVNGERQDLNLEPSTYCVVRRAWQSGDVVTLTLPMAMQPVPLPDAPDRVAVMYGPMVLTAISDGQVYVTGDPAKPSQWIRPEDEPLRFKVMSEGGERTVMPLYEVLKDPFAMYLQVRENPEG